MDRVCLGLCVFLSPSLTMKLRVVIFRKTHVSVTFPWLFSTRAKNPVPASLLYIVKLWRFDIRFNHIYFQFIADIREMLVSLSYCNCTVIMNLHGMDLQVKMPSLQCALRDVHEYIKKTISLLLQFGTRRRLWVLFEKYKVTVWHFPK